MKNRILSIVLAMVLVLTSTATALAAESRATRITPRLSFSGTTAQCEVIISNPSKSINATLERWKGSTLVQSWSANDTGLVAISESCQVTKRVTYTLKVSGTCGGTTISASPITKTCK